MVSHVYPEKMIINDLTKYISEIHKLYIYLQWVKFKFSTHIKSCFSKDYQNECRGYISPFFETIFAHFHPTSQVRVTNTLIGSRSILRLNLISFLILWKIKKIQTSHRLLWWLDLDLIQSIGSFYNEILKILEGDFSEQWLRNINEKTPSLWNLDITGI